MTKNTMVLILLCSCAADKPRAPAAPGGFHPNVEPGIIGGVVPESRPDTVVHPNLNCVGQCTNPQCHGCTGSPIVIDMAGDGYDLSGPDDGVPFDLGGTGRVDQIAWTKAGTDDAWLALDRDGDGMITSGAELFGNFTPGAGDFDANGFTALGVFDANGDGVIDEQDPIWGSLVLWTDSNHDGVSQREEMRPIAGSGITYLSLDWGMSDSIDDSGNMFQYWSEIGVAPESPIASPVFDVFLLSDGVVLTKGTESLREHVRKKPEQMCDIPQNIRMCRVDCYLRQSYTDQHPGSDTGTLDTCDHYDSADLCDRAGNVDMYTFIYPQLVPGGCSAHGRQFLNWNIDNQTSDEELYAFAEAACQNYVNFATYGTNCLQSDGFGHRGVFATPRDGMCITGQTVSAMQALLRNAPVDPVKGSATVLCCDRCGLSYWADVADVGVATHAGTPRYLCGECEGEHLRWFTHLAVVKPATAAATREGYVAGLRRALDLSMAMGISQAFEVQLLVEIDKAGRGAQPP